MKVIFEYFTGIDGKRFRNAALWGNWSEGGQPSAEGTWVTMKEELLGDGSQRFFASVDFPDASVGATYQWGVRLDRVPIDDQGVPGAEGLWGIVHEENTLDSQQRRRHFALREDQQVEAYYVSQTRHLGANRTKSGGARFAVWAPNAEEVRLVFAAAGKGRSGGYVANDGTGIVGQPIPMQRQPDGVWVVDETTASELADFDAVDHHPYMYQLRKAGAPVGQWSYRTDLYSRCQIGKGDFNPKGAHFDGTWEVLDGSVSCSVVVDPNRVTKRFTEPDWPETQWNTVDEFWANEFDPRRPVPRRIEDLVIYELHVGGLGFHRKASDGSNLPGTMEDAIELLPYLADLGINAIELLPMSEFDGSRNWGYATSHYCSVEFAAGGRDQMKHFVRACHQRGIAVILDVVYNHFTHHAERSQWAYDADAPEQNVYYWYKGHASDYSEPEGGYLDNMSTAWAPRYKEEKVRSLFASSAVALITEFHFDGFRIDQTTSIHSYNVLHADNRRSIGEANVFGAKMLRELTNAVRLVSPTTFLIAEDHSGWDAVTKPTDQGGLGFDAVWYADFYHHLAGDTDKGSDYAKLLTSAGSGFDGPLAMSYFSGALQHTNRSTVVYNESHDEAGNSRYSGRTLAISVGRAPLEGETRRYAEARVRFAAGVTLLSAGIPMFFMGEEVGFCKDYTYDNFVNQKEDFVDLRTTEGKRLFEFYRELIKLRKDPGFRELRDGSIDVFHVNDEGRTIAFTRTVDNAVSLVIATLSNTGYEQYALRGAPVAGRRWRQRFTSDETRFGGWGAGNGQGELQFAGDSLVLTVPRCGFVVLQSQG